MTRTRTTALACATVVLSALVASGTGTASGAAAPAGDRRAQAVEHAHGLLAQHGRAAARSASDAFRVRDVVVDPSGAEHVRFARTYEGLPVLGGDLVVHRGPQGAFRGVSRTQRSPLELDTTPATTAAQARSAARQAFEGTVDSIGGAQLVVTTRAAQPTLAWAVLVHGTDPQGGPSEVRTVLRASDLVVLERVQGIETAKAGTTTTPATPATGNTLYVGAVPLSTTLSGGTYSLKDPSRGGQSTADLLGATSGTGTVVTSRTASFGTGSTTSRATVAADAAYGVAQTWDYFAAAFGRRGIANDGRGALSRVHYGTAYNNAFWSDSCFCMTFGDGDGTRFTPLVSLDVTGHEMTHGITSRTAGLVYSGESGGLNEATSDIFGTMVEHRAARPSDAPDFTIGEEVVPAGRAPLRDMARPSRDGASPDCWYAGIGTLDVHHSSGPANHFFYLLAQGSGTTSPVCANPRGVTAVTGIGNAPAAAIWYRALTVHMTSSTGYAGARLATLQAATDLHGPTSPQRAAVDAAWAAAGVS